MKLFGQSAPALPVRRRMVTLEVIVMALTPSNVSMLVIIGRPRLAYLMFLCGCMALGFFASDWKDYKKVRVQDSLGRLCRRTVIEKLNGDHFGVFAPRPHTVLALQYIDRCYIAGYYDLGGIRYPDDPEQPLSVPVQCFMFKRGYALVINTANTAGTPLKIHVDMRNPGVPIDLLMADKPQLIQLLSDIESGIRVPDNYWPDEHDDSDDTD